MAFGRTQTQLTAKDILESDELKAKFDKLGEIDVVKTEVGEVKSLLSGIQDSLNAINVQNQQQQQRQQQQQQQTQQTVEQTGWLDDPDAAMNERLKPVVGLALDTRAALEIDRMSRARVKDVTSGRLVPKYPHWDTYNDEITRMLQAQPISARCRPDIIENCYKVIVGNHVDDISNDRLKGSGIYSVESATNGGGLPQAKGPKETMTDTDKKQATKFGMTEEQWLKAKKELNYVGV